jgi:hypothetical protein
VQAEPPSEVDKLISAITGQGQQTQWSDDAKKLFKETFGAEDPLAFKEQYGKVTSEVELLRKATLEGENLKNFYKRVEQEQPALAAALLEFQEGRDPLQYISKLANANILGKNSKELSDDVLAATYMRDKFSDEELNARRTGDYSSLAVDKEMLDAKFKMLRPAAEFMHDQRNKEYTDGMTKKQQQIMEIRERSMQDRAAALAHAQSDPVARLYLNQETIEAFHNNSFTNGVFTKEDGSLHPNALAATIKAMRYDSDVKRAYEAGLSAGKKSGLQEATSSLPDARPNGRVINMPTQQPGQSDPNMDAIAAVVGGRR